MDSLKVFIPHDLLITPSGWLLGWRDVSSKTVCVLATVQPRCDASEVMLQQLASFCEQKDPNLTILGFWKNDCNRSIFLVKAANSSSENWVVLHRKDSGAPDCKLNGMKPTSVIFDAKQVLKSTPLISKTTKRTDNSTSIEMIIQALKSFNTVVLQLPERFKRCIKTSDWDHHHEDSPEQSLHIHSCLPCQSSRPPLREGGVMSVLVCCSLLMSRLWQRVPGFIKQLCGVLMLWEQLQLKCNQVSNALFETGGTPKTVLRRKNVLCRFLFDIVCGVFLMMVLLQEDVTKLIAKTIMDWAEVVGDELSLLLEWLMGVPAGLKLNSHLDQLLGSFFLYHIYLWKGYLRILQPVFAELLWYGALSGCCGLSMQLSLMSDLLSMLTLHIYCFYAYAARLYSLQISTLASLWRLFRGKKRNPLRKRVDSTSYDVDQLFIGTLLFTILLFLLPTTGVYYIAFTTLRLVVIIISGCLGRMVSYINSLPVYSLIARSLHLAEMAGDIRLSVFPRCEGRPLCLSLQVVQSPVSEVYHLYKESDEEVTDGGKSLSWGEFGSNLITGKLLYPWISVKKEN